MNWVNIFSLAGGLGMFLFGMKLMSEGMEKAAGSKMRAILEFFTKNRLIGTFVGILFTAIIQSSNATTVMVVSFVNSGLMNLMQATGVILGANIGTTVTGQLVAFNLSDVAPLFVMLGVIMVMFIKKITVKRFGEVILGFGILFIGISTMGDAMSIIGEDPAVIAGFQSLKNPFLAILIGFLATSILQSSSATVGVLIVLARQGLLGFAICPFIIIGCNIGACVSALAASLSGRKDAKRAALIHLLFNIIGSTVILVVLLAARGPITDVLMDISGSPARAVANAHMMIKVCEVVMLFPFMGWIVKATYKLVPGGDPKAEDDFELLYIGNENMMMPTTVTVNAIHEIEHMGNMALENLKRAIRVLCSPEDTAEIEEIYRTEKHINFLNHKITDYLVKANELEITLEDSKILGGLFHVVNDIERIGDHAENMADAAKRIKEEGIVLSDKGKSQLLDMTAMTVKIMEYSIDMFSHKNAEHMQEIISLEDEIDQKEKKLQNSYIKRLTKGKCTPEAGMIFSDTVSGLERVADHCTNVAFAIFKPNDETDLEDD